MELRPYQSEAVDAVLREWESVRSTMLVLATGCGKTHTAAEIIHRRLDHGRVLWLAHRDELITQARDAIVRRLGGDVCVGIEQAGQYARVTSFDALADRVVVASVATLHAKRRSRFDASKFSTVIVDEAHHGAARSYRDILSHFPSAKVLGLTATPDRGDGVGLGEIFDSVAYEYGLLDAIRDGWLAPIKALAVNVAGLDFSKVKVTAGDLNHGQVARLLEVDEVHHKIASPLSSLMGDRKTLVFCQSVEQSKALADVIQGYLHERGTQVRHVDGTTPSETRKRILDEYANGSVQVICNVGVLTEGFDAPKTSCIALARPTKSRALYAQMVGRGTRLSPGKEDCLLVDFRGSAGKHSLANPVDLLAGKELSEGAKKIIAERMSDGKALDTDAMQEAEEEHARRLAEEDRKRAARAAFRVASNHTAHSIDLFAKEIGPGYARGKRESSPGQRQTLVNMGMEAEDVARLTFDQASRQIDKLIQRRQRGLCSYKQARALAKRGIRWKDVSFQEASKIMDAIAGNGWSVPDDIRARYAS